MATASEIIKSQRQLTAARRPFEINQNYSVKEAATVAGVSAITIWRAIYAGHLQTYRAGRRRILSGAQVKAWLDAGGRTSRMEG